MGTLWHWFGFGEDSLTLSFLVYVVKSNLLRFAQQMVPTNVFTHYFENMEFQHFRIICVLSVPDGSHLFIVGFMHSLHLSLEEINLDETRLFCDFANDPLLLNLLCTSSEVCNVPLS